MTKKPGQKGVEAIFSPPRRRRNLRQIGGAIGVSAGVILWTLLAMTAFNPPVLGTAIQAFHVRLTLAALGVLFIIGGVGTLRIPATDFELRQGAALPTPLDRDHTSADTLTGGSSRHSFPAGDILSDLDSHQHAGDLRLGFVVFLQSLLLIILYSGLTTEFDSNLTMQKWMQSIIPIGRYFLSWEGVLLASIVLGISVLQVLTGKISLD